MKTRTIPKRLLSILLVLMMVLTLLPTTAFALNGSSSVTNPYLVSTFEELQDAFDGASGTVYLKLKADISYKYPNQIFLEQHLLTVPKDATIVLDLAGHEISVSGKHVIDCCLFYVLSGSLVVNDSAGNGRVVVDCGAAIFGLDGGKTIINNGIFSNVYKYGPSCMHIRDNKSESPSPEVIINNGSFISEYGHTVYLESTRQKYPGNVLTINDGVFFVPEENIQAAIEMFVQSYTDQPVATINRCTIIGDENCAIKLRHANAKCAWYDAIPFTSYIDVDGNTHPILNRSHLIASKVLIDKKPAIQSVNITGIDAPVLGKSPDFVIDTLSSSVQYELWNMEWRENFTSMKAGDIFTEDNEYSVLLDVIVKKGVNYVFPDFSTKPDSITINGKKATFLAQIELNDQTECLCLMYKFGKLELPKLSGGIAYTSAANYDSPLYFAITGDAKAVPAKDLSFQWQKKTGGTWKDITDANVKLFTPGAAMIGQTVRVVVTANGYAGSLVSAEKVVVKKSGMNEIAAEPVIIAKTTSPYNSFTLQNYKTTQEYVWRTAPEADIENINWTLNRITSAKDGSVTVSGSVDKTYYIYTRVKETSTNQPGFFTKMSSVTLCDPNYLHRAVLDGYDSYGGGNVIYIPVNGTKSIYVEKDPWDAKTWSSFVFKSPVATSLFSFTGDATAPSGDMPGGITIKAGSVAGRGSIGAYYNDIAYNYGTWSVEVYDPADVDISSYSILSRPSYGDITLTVGDTYTPEDQSDKVLLAPAEANDQYHLEWRACTYYSTISGRSYNGSENELFKVDKTTGEVTALKETAGAAVPQLASVALFTVNRDGSDLERLAEYNVTILKKIVSLDGISIAPADITLKQGAEHSFKATMMPINATVTGTVSWSRISGSSSITVNSSSGKVTVAADAKDGDTAVIQASLDGKTATALVTVSSGKFDVKVEDGAAKVNDTAVTKAEWGSIVDIVANEAQEGKTFDKWVVDEGSISLFSAISETTSFNMPDKAVEIKANYKNNTQINTVAATLYAPVVDAMPSLAVSADPSFYVDSTNWEPAVDTVFAADTVYTAEIVIKAESGYAFAAAPTVTINGQTATVVSGDLKELKITYAFPKLGKSDSLPFSDVPETAWYHASVKGAYEMGLINGKTETSYKPADNMTYAEALKLAACMHQLYIEGEVTLTNGDPWYQPYIDYCYANGIISEENNEENGYKACLLYVDEKVTRSEYALWFSRALPNTGMPVVNDIPDNSIPDVPATNSVYNQAIYKLYRAGIVNGIDTKGTFNPDSNIQRSEVAAILIRMMDPSVRVGAPSELSK